MSFAPEIQGAIRAQIADCLVAVVCQRLSYNAQAKLLIPTLEIMMANTAVKASIRSGSLSQLGTAIQTGADDGMWSFDRYRRWVDQKRDWVRPTDAARLEDTKDQAPPRNASSPLPKLSTRPAAPKAQTQSSSGEPDLAASRIEISVEEVDLESLAKQIASEDESNE